MCGARFTHTCQPMTRRCGWNCPAADQIQPAHLRPCLANSSLLSQLLLVEPFSQLLLVEPTPKRLLKSCLGHGGGPLHHRATQWSSACSTAGRTVAWPSETFQQSPALHAIELQRKRLKNVADGGAWGKQPRHRRGRCPVGLEPAPTVEAQCLNDGTTAAQLLFAAITDGSGPQPPDP